MLVLVTYDIAEDDRWADLALLLSGFGPRVQLSVFECQLASRPQLYALRKQIRELIDPAADQVRFYELDAEAERRRYVLGARVLEERRDFTII